MGKSKIISTLGKVIGNTALHKFVAKYTNRIESVSFLTSEINAYRDLAKNVLKEHFWNEHDKSQIKKKALDHFNTKKMKKYSDLKIGKNEAEELVLETMKELGL